jgi:hypothetical protein
MGTFFSLLIALHSTSFFMPACFNSSQTSCVSPFGTGGVTTAGAGDGGGVMGAGTLLLPLPKRLVTLVLAVEKI